MAADDLAAQGGRPSTAMDGIDVFCSNIPVSAPKGLTTYFAKQMIENLYV